MGASFGNSDKGSVNVELNIVPFIDLMSYLTAFLLVTAVWVNMSQLQNEAVGDAKGDKPAEESIRLAVLIDDEHMTVSQFSSKGGGPFETRQVRAHDWSGLESALREFKTSRDLPAVEVAAESTDSHPIGYGELVTAMDMAVKVGYPRVGVVDAIQLQR